MITLKLFKKLGNLINENNFNTYKFNTLTEALEIAEYFYHNYFYQAQVIDSNGNVYAEYKN